MASTGAYGSHRFLARRQRRWSSNLPPQPARPPIGRLRRCERRRRRYIRRSKTRLPRQIPRPPAPPTCHRRRNRRLRRPRSPPPACPESLRRRNSRPRRHPVREHPLQTSPRPGAASRRHSRWRPMVRPNHRRHQSTRIRRLPPPHEVHRLPRPDRPPLRLARHHTELDHNPHRPAHPHSLTFSPRIPKSRYNVVEMKNCCRLTVSLLACALAALAADPSYPELLKAFTYRNLGPFRTGAWVAALAVPETPQKAHLHVMFAGARTGGVWRTTNSGTT